MDNTPLPNELKEEFARASDAERRRVERAWQFLGRAAPAPPAVPDEDEAWDDLLVRLADEEAAVRPGPSRAGDRAPLRGRVVRRLVLAAAVLTVVVVAGSWLWTRPVTVTVPAGEQRIVDLPDGSTVELNSATRLRYARGFERLPFLAASERTVRLEGEAFFTVRRAERPFVVETEGARVEVLGTQFNVHARPGPDGDETRVTLATGRVRVAPADHADQSVLLAASGETAFVADTVRQSMPVVRRLPADRVFAWRDRGFAALDQPLEAILAEVERRYAVRIVAEGVDLDLPMNVWYQGDPTVEHILQDICLARGCRFYRTSRGFALVAATPGATGAPR